jgi:hypothetical protein
MEELSLLGNFVRLADYLLVGGVTGRALAAAEDTLALLLAGREAVGALIDTHTHARTHTRMHARAQTYTDGPDVPGASPSDPPGFNTPFSQHEQSRHRIHI